MKKNVASQVVGAQMVAAADGSAFTSAVTVSVTGDGGAQATGSVGSGACTHEGNGFHTYVPAQAETNYDHVAFTFTGTGAIPATVQIYTSFPQTGDSFARVGAPAGASVSADVAAIKAETASILTDTAEIGAAGAGLTALATQTSVNTIDDFLDTEIAAIKAKTDSLTFTTANRVDSQVFGMQGNTMTAAAAAADLTTELQSGLATSAEIATLQTSVNTVDDLLDTEVAAIKTVVDAVKAKTDSLTFTVAGQVDANIQAVNDTAIQGTGAVGTDEWRAV
jgi:uncharacterized protein YunC (DUF1805 family)